MTDSAIHTATSRAPARVHKGHVLGLAALVTPLAQAYSWPIVTPIMALAALAMLIAVRGHLRPPPMTLLALLGVLGAYGAVSGLWGLSEHLALKYAGTVVATAVPGLILIAEARRLDSAERSWFEGALVLGFVIGLVNLQIILLTKGQLFVWLRDLDFVRSLFGPPPPVVTLVDFDTQMTLVSLMIWPVLGVVRRRYGLAWAALIGAAAFIVMLQSLSGTAKLAYMVGFAVLLGALLLPRWSAAALGAGLTLWIATAPLLYQSQVMDWGSHIAARISDRIDHSMIHRRAIWGYSVERIKERPLLGWGMGSSRIIDTRHQAAMASGLETMPLHPHNAALQLWLELGVPGALLGIAFVIWISLAVRRFASQPLDQALVVALVAALSINAQSGYNLWHTWWMTFIWLAAVFAMAALPAPETARDVRTTAPPAA